VVVEKNEELEIVDDSVAVVEDPGFELVDESTQENEPSEGEVDVDPAELAKHLEELKAQNEALKAQADSSMQLKGAFENFAQKLTPKAETVPAVKEEAPQVNIDWAQLEAQVNQDAFKNPFQTTMKSVAPVLQQMQSQFDFKLAQVEKKNKLIDSKLALTGDKGLSEIYNKYQSEVDSAVSGGMDYVAAAQRVRMSHEDEIIAEKVAEAVELVKEELGKTAGVPASPNGFTNSGNVQSSVNRSKVTQKVAVSAATKEAIRQTALNWAMDPNDPDDLKFVYDEFKKAGKL